MNRTARCLLAGLVAVVSMASVCEDEDNRVTGTYELVIRETLDTCDPNRELNTFASQVTISRGQDGFTLEFGEEATLTGDFNDEGTLVAEGNIVVEREGQSIAALMQVQIVIKQGQITLGSGRLTFNGTFPGRTGTCVQEFGISGSRNDNRVPVVG